MKAYLITTGEYSDFAIESVWLDREDAEAWIAMDHDPETGYSKRGRYADEYVIQEWDVSSALTPPAEKW
jgi:heme-degrading monooxygenase HmoA